MTVPQLQPGDLVRIRNERWRIARRVPYGRATVIEVEGAEGDTRGERVCFLLPFEPIDRVEAPDVPRVTRPQRWRHLARRALSDAAPSVTSLRAPARAHLTLVPFQLEPALAQARGDGCRFLIADAVGMGKTVQAGLMIAELLHRRPEGRVLVIVPAGLREQWRDELHVRFGLDAHLLDASGVARAADRLPVGMNPWAVHRLAITSIDYVKRPEVLRCHEALIWDLVVLDEAHGVAGRSDRAAAAAALGGRARTLVMLTATPHSGDEDAFRRLCGIGDLNDGFPLLVFRRTRQSVGTDLPLGPGHGRREVLLRVRPRAAEAAMHAALMDYARLVWARTDASGGGGARLAVSVLLRRACSSASSLARSVERRMALLGGSAAVSQGILPMFDLSAGDEEPHAVLATPGLRDTADEQARLHRILGLARQASDNESKLAALRKIITRTREPVIVFTEYRDTLQQLASTMPVEAVFLHGGLPSRERTDGLRQFTEGDARLLLATDAASEGLNLHHRCRLVVNLELPWTPLRLEQRVGRVDRIGQTRRVHAVHLVAASTSEEAVLARLAARTWRMHTAFRDIAEQEIAECMVSGRMVPLTRDCEASVARAGIAAPHLEAEARIEAERLSLARALAPRCEPAESRPLITRVRRRGRRAGARCFWLFHVLFTAPDGRVVHQAVLPLGGDVGRGSTPRQAGRQGPPYEPVGSALARRLLDPRHPAVQRAASQGRDAQLHALRLALRGPVRVQLQRERAIAETLRSRQARLSATLLQLGLFDRRSERARDAQSALLAKALAECTARIAALQGSEDVRADSPQLVCAIAVE
ncbi:MAG: DEAD/DEAH box helicase [Acidobacteria bacterium]|nr:DEAD/DEAH box helicase [Acidobacteriota bacterium]